MKIIPLGNNVQLEIEEASAGMLDTSSRESAVEYAKVVAIGTHVNRTIINPDAHTSEWIKVDDHVFVKAWAIDIINYEGKKYYFCNLDTNGILAVVK